MTTNLLCEHTIHYHQMPCCVIAFQYLQVFFFMPSEYIQIHLLYTFYTSRGAALEIQIV